MKQTCWLLQLVYQTTVRGITWRTQMTSLFLRGNRKWIAALPILSQYQDSGPEQRHDCHEKRRKYTMLNCWAFLVQQPNFQPDNVSTSYSYCTHGISLETAGSHIAADAIIVTDNKSSSPEEEQSGEWWQGAPFEANEQQRYRSLHRRCKKRIAALLPGDSGRYRHCSPHLREWRSWRKSSCSTCTITRWITIMRHTNQ